MDITFYKKIEELFKNKQFETVKFEIDLLNEEDKRNPFLYNILGIIEATNNNNAEAKKYFNLAIEIDKYYLQSLINLSNLSYIDKDFQNIIALFKNYHLKFPDNDRVILILADLCFSAGFVEETIHFHKKLIEIGKYQQKDLAALIFLLNYSNKYSDEEYKKYCKIYDEILLKNKITYNISKIEHDRAKIGFLSYDLRDHSVGYFLKDFVKKLNEKNFKTIAFNLFRFNKDDLFTSDLKNSFTEWYDVSDHNDKDLSDFIYSKKVHYLIDLAGYSTGNRLQVFKNKPAPVQISWLGYCNDTHIDEIDYIVADENVVSEKKYANSKKIIKMPKIWNSLSKLEDVKTNELPFITNKIFTFGCFNNFLKISEETIEIWAKILEEFNNSKLVLKNSVSADKNYKKYLIEKFGNKVDENRIIILNYEKKKKKHLEHYLNIDLCLDTFPYNGVTTTFESLWMGVPVITLKGDKFISRCGYSINKNAGLNDFIADTKDDYISIALNSVTYNGIEKLKSYRKNLRSKIISSPLFDVQNFSDNFADKLYTIKN